MVNPIKNTMKMNNAHHTHSDYDSEFDSYMSEYDSDVSDGERYEMYSAHRKQFVSWWK